LLFTYLLIEIASAIPQGHSIIEEIKAKYNVPKQMPLPKPTITPTFTPTYQNTYQASEDFDVKASGHLRPKKKTQRPKELDYVRTIPEEPLPDVQFVKAQDPQERIKKRVEFDIEEEPKRAAGPQRTTPPVQREREEETIRRDEYEERRTQAQQREEQPHYYQEERDIREEIRRQEPREETKESLVHINMDRYNVKVNSSQEMKPKDTHELSFDQVKGSDALFNGLFEYLLSILLN